MENNSRLITCPDTDFDSNNQKVLLLDSDQLDVLRLIDSLQRSTKNVDLYVCNTEPRHKAWVDKVLPRMHKVLFNEKFNTKLRKKITQHPYFVKYSDYTQLLKELEL